MLCVPGAADPEPNIGEYCPANSGWIIACALQKAGIQSVWLPGRFASGQAVRFGDQVDVDRSLHNFDGESRTVDLSRISPEYVSRLGLYN